LQRVKAKRNRKTPKDKMETISNGSVKEEKARRNRRMVRKRRNQKIG